MVNKLRNKTVVSKKSLRGLHDKKDDVTCYDNGHGLAVQDVLDALPFYVMLIDEEHNILEANKAVHTHLGMKREDILGKYCPQVIHGQNDPFQGCPLEEAVAKNVAVERELLDNKTGRWVSSVIYPIDGYMRDGKKVYVHMLTDVTERILAQRELETSHEQLRQLSAFLESIREEEKQKIARDLHDETSQVLSSLYTYLETAIGTLPKDAHKTEAILRKAQTLSTTILDEIRKLIYELRPIVLDKLGLVAAIKSLAENYLRISGLEVNATFLGRKRRLLPSLEIVLFRVIQEAFNNIVKHAHASKVELNMQFRTDSIKISIKDDGIGFNVQETTGPRYKKLGLGLLGMKERIELINGSLSLVSTAGHGTEVTIKVPVKKGGLHGQDKVNNSR